MQHPPAPDREEEASHASVASLLDPQRYLREADRALANGHRDDAIALVAKAYLAFDLLRPR
jgi:hypothetical protein